MENYSIKECSNRKHHSNVTLQLPVTELQELNQLSYRFGRSCHSILYSAYRKGLPTVIANLEGRQNTKQNNEQDQVKE